MNGFNWNENEANNDESFGDRSVGTEDNNDWQEPAPSAQPAPQRVLVKNQPSQPDNVIEASEEIVEQLEDEQEEDYSAVLADAKIRLAMGTLYEMLMNNSIFQDLDVDPKAIKTVERKVKNFAREQMEIMLGMRQEQAAQTEVQVASPFNDLEVEALKALASAATKGATQKPEAQTFSGTSAQVVTKKALTPISGPKKAASAPQKLQQRLPASPKAPINRKRDATVDQILAEEGVTREELEAVFPSTYKQLEKPPGEMSDQEVLRRNQEASKRLANRMPVKSATAMPMPDQETINAQVMNRAAVAAANPQMQSLMNLLTQAQNNKKQ